MKINVAVVTGARADYGLFYPLLNEINKDSTFELLIFATGMHLSPEFGLTYKEIENDGFKINEKIEMLLSSDTESAISKSIGLGVIQFSEVFKRHKPDIIILLGDRFEIFSAAIAAYTTRIPIAHIHGGELTEGAIDEGFRHSMTKMSLLHFVTTDKYRQRVIQLGEEPKRVFNTGALGIDNIIKTRFLSKEVLEKELNFSFMKNNFIVTFHPVTTEKDVKGMQFRELLYALDRFSEIGLIFTYPNADANGRIIIKLINEYVLKRPGARAYPSLGQQKYLSILKYINAVVGNSSSGIIEAPSFGIPTINIGRRQDGRIKAESVINSKPKWEEIRKAIEKTMSPKFKRKCLNVKNPYGDGHSAERICSLLKKNVFEIKNNQKSFFDFNK